jgi:predicted RNA-binding Zn ribbon-like protein
MHLKERPAAKARLVGGQLCLDFVNTVGGRSTPVSIRTATPIRDDMLNEYADVVAWSLHAGLLTEPEAGRLLTEAEQRGKEAAVAFNRAIALREAIYRLCLAVAQRKKTQAADLILLNEELDEARRHEALVPGKENFVWQWTAQDKALDRMLWPIADSAAEFLTAGDLTRLRECGGEDCGWLFEDTSRNGKRQWCMMEDCGNLAKVRRFRLRQEKQSQ